MSEFNRRQLVTTATAATMISSLFSGMSVFGQLPQLHSPKSTDETPQNIQLNLLAMMLSKPTVFKLEEDGRSRDLIFSNVLDENGRKANSYQKQGTIRILRPDPESFSKNQELSWSYHGKTGTVKIEHVSDQLTVGPMIMVLREWDGTVRCYSMTGDFRC